MSEKHELHNEDQITFTLGKGNHSSICGGVAPMAVDSPQNNMVDHSTDKKNPVSVEGEALANEASKAE